MFTIAAVSSETGVVTKGTLAEREIFVGRSRKCQLMLKEETVSGVHCRLIAVAGAAIVMDEGSTNGTWLNGKLVVQPTVMTENDELRVGPYLLRVQSLVPGEAPAEPRALEERPVVQEVPTDIHVSQSQVFWALLGFRQPGTLEQARAAYQARVAECSQDTVSELQPQLRALAEQRLRELEFAWDYIQRLLSRARSAA